MKVVRIQYPPREAVGAPENMRAALIGISVSLPTPEDLKKSGLDSFETEEEYLIPLDSVVAGLKKAQRYGAADYWEKEILEPVLRFRKKLCIPLC